VCVLSGLLLVVVFSVHSDLVAAPNNIFLLDVDILDLFVIERTGNGCFYLSST